MTSRRDQLHAYQFMTQRIIAAFVMRETDPAQSPLRRGVGAIFGGTMVVIIVAVAFGIYGLLTRVGGDTWKVEGSVVIERETGATFVFLGGRLMPTPNYASALLASGRVGAPVSRVSRQSLAAVPRGLPIGIPGAPNSLPDTQARLGMPWSICSGGGGYPDLPGVSVSLVVGSRPAGFRAVVGDGEGILVRAEHSQRVYLVTRGFRFPLDDPELVIPALFGALQSPSTVGVAWLNALPTGMPITPIAIPRRGKPSEAVPRRHVGDLLVAQTGSGPQYYLVFDDGLAPVTELQKGLSTAQYLVEAAPVSISEAESYPRSSRLAAEAGQIQPPPKPPTLLRPESSADGICVSITDARSNPEVTIGGALPQVDAGISTGSRTRDGTPLADRVIVPPGRIAVVRVLASPGAGSGPLFLVTDSGVRHAVASEEALRMLGYQPAQAVDVPARFVSRIPAGATLDPAVARKPVSTDGSAGDPTL